jgi:predicted DsbA family dithiol-disulfide isomerase
VSYEIHPETPAGGVRLEELFGPRHKEMQAPLAARCRELGLALQAPDVLSNSRLAVEAAEFAREAGKHGAFHRAVLAAYFAHGRDIGDIEVLQEVATEAGLDPAALSKALEEGRCADRREAVEQEAHRLGVQAVPTFIFDDGARVVGAQPLEYFRRLFAAMLA